MTLTKEKIWESLNRMEEAVHEKERMDRIHDLYNKPHRTGEFIYIMDETDIYMNVVKNGHIKGCVMC